VPSVADETNRAKKETGLRYWMQRVPEECDKVLKNFDPDPVHDLRVALRRCRSLADGLMALDPDPAWKDMKKAGKRLFKRLGELRDTHVMMEWVEKLVPASTSEKAPASEETGTNAAEKVSDDHQHAPAARALLEILRGREKEQKLDAQAAVEEFDRKQWRHWSKSLPVKAGRIRPGSMVFKHLALERWTAARELQARALRNRSQVALHSLRIGIKKFRYIVENFLPVQHRAWSDDLKEMQDLLGEVHDLDVLWNTAVKCRVFPDTESRNQWHQRIITERAKRIERYRVRMVGEDSLWSLWRAGLPQGKQVQTLATQRMKLWARALDPDIAHSERVTRLALELYDGLLAWGWEPAVDAAAARSSLFAAAMLHDVGKSEGQKKHQKVSFDLIREHGSPLGWNIADLQRAAAVARFHRGSLPTRRHKNVRDLLPDEQKATIQLAAILRLANALDATHDGHIQDVQVVDADARKNGATRRRKHLAITPILVLAARGYRPTGPAAATIAKERHLLETVLRRPVLVRPARRA
jgi:CHAD domain-containing protein